MGQDEAARMLRTDGAARPSARRAEIEGQPQAAVGEVQVQLRQLRFGSTPSVGPGPDLATTSAPIRSSGRPMALPTSRSAPLAR